MAETPGRNEGDERRQLLVRGGTAVALIGVLLAGLVFWERSQQQTVAPPPPARALPTPEALREATVSAPEAVAAVAEPESEPEVEASAPAPETSVPPPVAEETRAAEAPAAPSGPLPPAEDTAPHGAVRPPAPRATPAPRNAEAAQGARLSVMADPAPPGAKPPGGRAFALQVGVFSNPVNAEELRARLSLAGIPAHVETRVHVGPFATRQEATAAQARLKALGLERGQLVTVKP